MCRCVTLLLMSLLVHLIEPSSERSRNLTLTIDAAIDLLSKAKSDIPVCSEEKRMTRALDCSDLYERGIKGNGVYPIWPINRLSRNSLDVYCDMSDGGGWTILNRKAPLGRVNEYFDKDWATYKMRFGKSNEAKMYIGNDNNFMLTNQKQYIARFYQYYFYSKKYLFADCEFWIDDEFNNYTLHISNCSGPLSKAMLKFNEMKFSTKDKDNDPVPGMNCAENKKYGFWFSYCRSYIKAHDISRMPITGIKIRPSTYLSGK